MIKAVIFDLDGTITKPFLDFQRIIIEVGAEIGRLALLEQIEQMPDDKREKAMAVLEKHELDATENAEFNDGVEKLLDRAKGLGLKTAILTRNSEKSTQRVLEKLGIEVDMVITRDSDVAIKPDPAAIHLLSRKWDIDPYQMLMVGDFRYDIDCGRAAGAITCLVTNAKTHIQDGGPHYKVETPGEVVPILEELAGEGGGSA